MKRVCLILLVLAAALVCRAGEKVKVACVGNSITYGYLLSDREHNAYPFQLQRMLGPGYEVGNFGNSGATLLDKGHKPYRSLPEYKAALEFDPDIVVIHLGVNDTDPRNWPNRRDEFSGNYVSLINDFKERNPQVRVIVALLSPLRAGHHRFRTGTRDWRLMIQDAIKDVARATESELIDFDTPLRDRQNLIFDNIHPNEEGAGILAETVRGAITGRYGGLRLPPVWQSGMVVQRHRPLPVRGRADAGAKIALTLDGRTYRTVADNRGDWSITTAPLVAGKAYDMTVTDGDSTVTLTDILAGEVWIASGQSNMEFPLRDADGGTGAIAASADSLLRVFDMKPIARTDPGYWPDSILEATDRLEYFRSAVWQPVGPANAADFSAVAYFFAKALRDSLQVPVGIISNAVGGSPAEAWIDVNTLEREVPEILINWRGNDYLQKWCQQRIGVNIGDRNLGRHPYEPSYLFSSAIRPLKGFPVAGTIWYQGESNAHNVELHEQLFPLLTESWRNEFDADSMPFYFVQLSSLGRPSWPHFRDSQRRLAERIPHTGMAVSSDKGDPDDVHPRKKRPVGERLSRLALRRTYGFDVEDSGPALRKAVASRGRMTLTFDHAEGLATSDGAAPRTFEIAEIEGIYYPAEAEIIDNKIILTNMDVKNPRFVRYGWQPYTEANVINGAELPASTFRAEADNAADFDIEPGYERGVSAPFFGMLEGRLVIAGGCNFPVDEPLTVGADAKRSYRGIYAADTADLVWHRIGSLPCEMAYGASAMTARGPVFLGTNRHAWLLLSDGSLAPLPDMPVASDNACAAAIGNTVYICGGNCDGKPSKELYCLDLDGDRWRKLHSMPGNPRVQPVMAASGGKLYLWGGFAGKHDGKDATLETGGLCYNPVTDKWTPLPAPVDASGAEISLGGGCAVTLSDGRIAACGGVNKDIFLAALQNQASDYLFHPIDWYRFNQNVLVYNPASASWSIAQTTPDFARAGAAAMTDGTSIWLYGGELKPRIRTSETVRTEL